MPCTTLLVGRKASYDGSTMIARNDDSPAGSYTPKKLTVVMPEDQPRRYRSVISHVEINLPDDPMRYTAVPNALSGEGIWAGAGINAAHIAMTATETIASNERVLGADPLVVLRPADGDTPEQPGGIGEEDIVTLVLPYIRSAKEGVLRLGELLENYGTYEMNGIAFSDREEIWWMETFGGHHWIAKKVPDDQYVVMPNQSGIDSFDLDDALGDGTSHLCSPDLKEFIAEHHLDLSRDGILNPRDAFGTHDDADRIYNTPRAWAMCRYFNPRTFRWDGPEAQYRPTDDDIPWSLCPEKKITVEDVKYILSNHFQGTPYDPYGSAGDASRRGAYRCIGVNRTDFLALLQLRPDVPDEICGIEWLTFGSNVFNTFVPFYTDTDQVPDYLSRTDSNVDTDSFYWNCRLIAALADAQYSTSRMHIERYQIRVQSEAHAILNRTDRKIRTLLSEVNESCPAADDSERNLPCPDISEVSEAVREANEELAGMLRRHTGNVLGLVLDEAGSHMKNAFSRSDA